MIGRISLLLISGVISLWRLHADFLYGIALYKKYGLIFIPPNLYSALLLISFFL